MERQSRLLGTAEVARLLGVDASTVKRWADSGKLPCCKTIGGHRRFAAAQVQEFITAYHLEAIVLTDSPVQSNPNVSFS